MSKIKHVSFDFWGTIAKPNTEFYRQRVKYLAEITGRDEDVVGDRIVHFKEQFEFFGKETLTGTPAQTQTFILLQSLGFQNTLGGFGQIYAHLQELYYKYPPILIVDLNTLSTLKGKDLTFSITCNTGFLSGALVENWLNKHTLLHGFFNDFIFSDDCGNMFKPNPLIYNTMAGRFSLKSPTEILHVGDDDTTDGELCRRTGMQFFKVVGDNYADILKYV